MTEEEWLACEEPGVMLEGLRRRVKARKLRLFACACCRSVEHEMYEDDSRRSVEVAERYADKFESTAALTRARRYALEAVNRSGPPYDAVTAFHAAAAALSACESAASDAADRAWRAASTTRGAGFVSYAIDSVELRQQAHFLRDIFGNPFRPATVYPSWLTPTVVGLAAAIYEGRAFDRLPVLADALEEAGCDNADVLAHCRGDGPHARGCWVVDLILGKS